MSWLLRLYPRRWRRRYGDELMLLLETEPRSFRLFLDLLAGAIDARLNPQWVASEQASDGDRQVGSIRRLCASPGFSAADTWRSAGWMIGGSIGFVLLALALRKLFGLELLSQTVLFAAYPMALVLAGQSTYLKPYSPAVRTTLLVLGLAATFGFFYGVTLLAERI